MSCIYKSGAPYNHVVHLCWLFMYYHNQLYKSMSWIPTFSSCTIHSTSTSCLCYHTTNGHVRHVPAMAGTSICTYIGISFGGVLKDSIWRHLSKTRTFMTSPSVSLAIPTQHRNWFWILPCSTDQSMMHTSDGRATSPPSSAHRICCSSGVFIWNEVISTCS